VFTCRLNMRGQVRVSDSPSQSEPLSVDMLYALDPAPAEHPLPDDSARSRLVPLDGSASTRACPRKDMGVGMGGRGVPPGGYSWHGHCCLEHPFA
jgi:hypothetical protein